MNKRLICRTKNDDGIIGYIIFDMLSRTVETVNFEKMVDLIINIDVSNAKLENAVVKMTDSVDSIVTLNADDSKQSTCFYLFDEEEEYSFVSNTGQIFRMTDNVISDFFRKNSGRIVVNARVLPSGSVSSIGTKRYTSALTRSLVHVHHVHH